ncbi:MAG: cation transport ATPase [Candidatus Azotimanducaceae bacterium]
MFIFEMGGHMFLALHHWVSGNDRTNQQLACTIYSYHACNDLAGAIITLILVGRFHEARAKGRTGEAIARLVV